MNMHPFEVGADTNGAYLTVGGVRLAYACKGKPEIEVSIERIKRQLDKAVEEMDVAWREQDKKPDF